MAERSVDEIFAAEARGRVEEARRVLEAGFPKPGSREASLLYRHAHSLKGTAGSLGYSRIERLSQEICETVAPLERDSGDLPEAARAAVRRAFEDLAREVDKLR